jgi:polyferredoxin
VLYFGKKAPSMRLDSMARFLTLPSKLPAVKWTYALSGFAAWASMLLMTVGGVYLAVHFIANRKRYFTSAWKSFKYAYYASMFVLFGFLYLSRTTGGSGLFGYGMGFWYTAMYSLTIVVFGLRRMHVNPTGYIKRQTWLLMAIQVIPLFILPALVFPWMGKAGLFNGWIMRNVFPNGSYWRGYGFILAWPLFIHILASGQPYIFWLVAGCVQTFVLIPWINYVWGKGAYCGWICSCGALAETLGDEYRTLAPHGPAAKKADNIGQVVLWFAGFVSALLILKAWVEFDWEHTVFFRDIYDILVDVFFAGVLGVGVYFFMSGRVWCRFLCPLAALMHIYTRFSKYRIMSNKKRCISCGICTGVCHMGIDVMGYANRGVPMNDVECVRCSACIVSCPMQVLTFGDVGGVDLNNTAYRKGHIPLKRGWESGLMKKDIDMLLADEAEMHPETGARQE